MEKHQTIKAYGLITRVWTFDQKDRKYGCAECCNGDRCDEDCTAKYKGGRVHCPHCKGKGWIPELDTDFQQRVLPWLAYCFEPEVALDVPHRNARFIEEALELVQSTGFSKEDVLTLVDYVYSRPVGEPYQEMGGVMITLAALGLATGLDMAENGEIELERINTPEIIEKIRKKQATKPKHSPLPGKA